METPSISKSKNVTPTTQHPFLINFLVDYQNPEEVEEKHADGVGPPYEDISEHLKKLREER